MLTQDSVHVLPAAACSLALLVGHPALADIHYVSTVANSVYPYTTEETAARDIHDALDAAEVGDTVQVLPGTYFTSVERSGSHICREHDSERGIWVPLVRRESTARPVYWS